MPVIITEDVSVGEAALHQFENRPNDDDYGDVPHPMDDDIQARATYPNMTYPNHTIPSTHIYSQQIDTMALPPQYPLPTVLQPLVVPGLPFPNGMNPSPPVGWIQQRPQKNSINTDVIMHHHHTLNAPYPTPPYPPLSVVSFVPPELLYNIEDGQQQYANHHQQQQHATMYEYETETVDVADTQLWDEYGFRLEPPPNSTTLLHKMMMM